MLSGYAGRHQSYTRVTELLRFPVVFVAAAPTAVFAQLEPVGGVLFVFERVVVTALALRARHGDHHAVLFFCHFNP
jgi:hypothetical protein